MHDIPTIDPRMLHCVPRREPRGVPLCAFQAHIGHDTLPVPRFLTLGCVLRLASAPQERYAVPRIVDDATFCALQQHGARTAERASECAHGAWSEPRSLLDLYSPRIVRHSGADREGLCPVCYEHGAVRFYCLRRSAYSAHMRHVHRVSQVTGMPLVQPRAYATARAGSILLGLCTSHG